MGIVASMFSNLEMKVMKPKPDNYPCELNTIGDHLRKVRMDRGLYQTDVAKIIGCQPDSIVNWEKNKTTPQVSIMKSIIEFLGYIPFSYESESISKRLFVARKVGGETCEVD